MNTNGFGIRTMGMWAFAGLIAVACPIPASASAYEVGAPTPTSQAIAAQAEFLINPAVPPPTRTAVCLVDSGVADSALSDFADGQVTRYAPEDGAVADSSDTSHGTSWLASWGPKSTATAWSASGPASRS